MDRQEPQIHEVWTFSEDGVTREVHPKARVDVSARFVGEFATGYLNPSWHRITMFGVNYINGSVKWLGVLTSSGPMDPLGLQISWLPILVGNTEVPPIRD